MPALSKKQQKALAFRQKRKGAKKDDAVLDVPEMDLDDTAELDDATPAAPEPVPSKPVTGKRKREDAPPDEPPAPQQKKHKAAPSQDQTTADTTNTSQKPKFILFLGNLRYTTTKEQIAKHFSECIPAPDIRLLTPRSLPGKPAKPTIKSKGCAFLEFHSHNTLQQGLKLHGSELDGRKINVELTAGGGGKSTSRLDKVRERNKALTEQRKKKLVKTGAASDEQASVELIKPQRHSGTSGEERAAATRKTWSVPEGEEVAGRGGKKHAKKQRGAKKSSKPWASGSNAIAVG